MKTERRQWPPDQEWNPYPLITWMNTPNIDLSNEKPIDVISKGENQKVFDLIVDLSFGRII